MIIRRMQQVIQFSELRFSRVLFYDAATPEVRSSVSEGTEDTIQLCGLVCDAGELKLDRIDIDRVGISKIGPAIDEPTKRLTVRGLFEYKFARRGGVFRARQGDVDKALG